MRIRDSESMHHLRQGRDQGRGAFRLGADWAILDPHLAHRVNAANYADDLLPDRLVDLLRGRRSPAVSWKQVRAGWAAPLKAHLRADRVAALEGRLRAEVEARLERALDLAWAGQEIFTRPLIPVVVAGLEGAERHHVEEEQDVKLARLMRPVPREDTISERLRSAAVQIQVGRVVRRVLRERARGRRARQVDLADPLVDLLPDLGMDRASNAVTAVFTAIAGPPGAVAACLLLELARRPRWERQITAELSAVPDPCFRSAPQTAAPITHRFVKEVLRFWSSPLVLTRVARRDHQVEEERIEAKERFHLSPYFGHRDPEEWDDPDSFDPGRWQAGVDRGPRNACAYSPFGYPPISCIGAGLGLVELMLLCRLFTTRYRIEPEAVEEVEMVMASVPLPIGFRGRITRR